MKKLHVFFLTISIFLLQFSFAQNIDTRLTKWAKENPIEKVYLQFDRENYFSGQTIWFKGYFTNGFVPSANSSTLYVELLDDQSSVLIRNIFPAYLGSVVGQIDLSESLPAGNYQIRAYSPVMLNQSAFIFNKGITVFGAKNKKPIKENKILTNQIRFFPEGGNFITGKLNKIAFKATDKNGMPMDVDGTIFDNKNMVVVGFKTTHDGMGTFAIIPLEGESYYAIINQTGEKINLPEQTKNGILFSVVTSAKGKLFRIEQGSENQVFKPAYLVGQMENEIIFKQPLTDKKIINGLIDTKDFYSGILQLTVFNKDDMPLAERITFIDNKEYTLSATLKTDTLNTDERAKNHFTISLQDTVIGNFSVSVTDADFDEGDYRSSNIYSWLLLSSDIKGYIHNPSYYFESNADSIKTALDMVMMTNGWTRFNWKDIKENKLPSHQFKDPGYINVKGTVYLEGRKKVLSNKDIIVLMSQADTTLGKNSFPRIIHTDSLGQFQMDSLRFFDRMKFLFSDVRGNKSKYISVKLDSDSLARRFPIEINKLPFTDSSLSEGIQNKMNGAYKDYQNVAGTTLATVTVRARQKSETEKLDEEYSSALFTNNINGKILDLRNEIFSGDIFQYLQGRLAGLSVSGSPGDYKLIYRGGGFGDGGNVNLFLDEMPVDASMIEAIPVNQIAVVKLLPHSIASPGGGAALAIYMKKGADLKASIDSPTDILVYKGYTIIKEFYQPNYDLKPNNDKRDNRLTLSWMPYLYVSSVNPQIPVIFYNNDRTKRLKIVAEGITNDGRLLMLEKIIEPKK